MLHIRPEANGVLYGERAPRALVPEDTQAGSTTTVKP